MEMAKMAFGPLCIHDRARWLNAFYTSISGGGARERKARESVRRKRPVSNRTHFVLLIQPF